MNLKKIILTAVAVLLFFSVNAQEQNPEHVKFIEITEKVSVIKMLSTDTVIYRKVNITPTEIVVLEFPEEVLLDGDPSGSIAVGHDAILKTDVVPSPLVVKVTAMINEVDLNSNLQIKLNCGITVIFNFVITLPEKASNRIIFTYPEFTEKNKKEKDAFLELKLKLQKEHETAMKKVKEEANKLRVAGNAKGFSEFYMCNEYVNRSEDNLVFLTSTRICKWGGKKDKGGDVYINFYIKNRYRNFFYVKEIKVYGLKGDSKVPIDNTQVFLEKFGIQFDEVLNGAVGFELDDYYTQYRLELEEEAGKKRVIFVNVGF
ncbi:MAG TPA: hypothetical protein VLJ60_08830 [bacterium]|nr:hypothetical protein [bacterium]